LIEQNGEFVQACLIKWKCAFWFSSHIIFKRRDATICIGEPTKCTLLTLVWLMQKRLFTSFILLISLAKFGVKIS
jgi:hypothetical protein